ncbi:hypothetical protein PLICRDRAFT_687640 [Plicaturopsis crispa FD-325 SS-3]|nr:hypothetical protein PLICRDRAFT_687640 [Plicaturopsis crispa FD-325 SS-3]
MRLPLTLVLTLLVQQTAFALAPAKRYYSSHDYYVIEHDPRAGASLDECARSLGVEVVEQAGELRDHWLVRAEKPVSGLLSRGESDRVLDLFQSLRTRAASKRDSWFSRRSTETQRARRVVSSVKYLAPQTLRKRTKRDDSLLDRAPPPIIEEPFQGVNSSKAIALRLGFKDPLFVEQWHIANDEFPQHMMNPTPVWEELGFTGQGVISALVDDGLDYRSDDLAANFDASGSYDFNDHTDLPTPALFDDHHGTRCGGQIAAVKNELCGVGIAYNSKVAGLRILSGPISDIDEAAALNYAYQNTSIYSCSWGPPDDGKSMEGPGYLINKAVVNGVEKGRDGKGSVFVFASGNGAAHGDQCNFDGYTNSIYSVTVAAIDYKGLHPYYSESCAANMIVAYSSGSGQHIVTTDIGKDKCSKSHGGTSAAAPNAVGVFALALEARPDLTWRDIQHLCVRTARKVNPEDPDWDTISEGRQFSYKYGFGALDAYAYVKAAQSWQVVKPQAWFQTPTVQINGGAMNLLDEMSGGKFIAPGGITETITVTKEMLEENNFEKLEHVTIKVWIKHTRRGDVEVELVSPHGIKSVLAAPRKSDAATTGFPGWTFMSVKHWEEDPVGDWTIRVADQNSDIQLGYFLGWNLKFWGSTIDPSKAKPYESPMLDSILPPPQPDGTTKTGSGGPSATKSHPKPTAHLPGDHGTAEGEASKPAFPGAQDDAAEATATPTPDEGWFSDMSNLASNKKWFFGAVAVVMIFGIAAGVFFWRRRVARQTRANYAALSGGDGLAMSSMPGHTGSGAPRTKELYDAFGEVSDDEDDADESTGLRGGRPQDRSPGGLGFHEGFLDDDDPQSAGPTPLYKDEPDAHDSSLEAGAGRDSPDDRARSPGSGDGSWEHASQTR